MSSNTVPVLYRMYVDDLNMVLKETLSAVEEEAEEADKKTARHMRMMANTIMPRSMVMEEDYPSRHLERKITILDMQMWITHNQTKVEVPTYATTTTLKPTTYKPTYPTTTSKPYQPYYTSTHKKDLPA